MNLLCVYGFCNTTFNFQVCVSSQPQIYKASVTAVHESPVSDDCIACKPAVSS